MTLVKLTEVKEGEVLIADGDFTCHGAGPITIMKDEHGLYFECEDGEHYLDGQENDEGVLVGLSRPAAEPVDEQKSSEDPQPAKEPEVIVAAGATSSETMPGEDPVEEETDPNALDAARYRWIKSHLAGYQSNNDVIHVIRIQNTADQLGSEYYDTFDAVIDASMKGQ